MPSFFLIDEVRGHSPISGASMVAQTVKNLPAMQETQVPSLGREPTLSDPMDCSLPGSSVHGIFQARVLEWDAMAFSIKGRDRLERRLA